MRTSEYNIYIYFKDDIILFLYVSYQSFITVILNSGFLITSFPHLIQLQYPSPSREQMIIIRFNLDQKKEVLASYGT